MRLDESPLRAHRGSARAGRLVLVRLLALAAVALNIAVTVGIWRVLRTDQEMWPFPGLYLIEMVALPTATALAALTRAAIVAPP